MDPNETITWHEVSEHVEIPNDSQAVHKMYYKYVRELPEGEMIVGIYMTPYPMAECVHVVIRSAKPDICPPINETHKQFCEKFYGAALTVYEQRKEMYMHSSFNPKFLTDYEHPRNV